MKTLKLGFAALLLTLAVGASAFKSAHATAKLDPTYNWTNGSTTDLNKTISEAQDDYGCAGSASVCATGTPVGGGDQVQIKFDN